MLREAWAQVVEDARRRSVAHVLGVWLSTVIGVAATVAVWEWLGALGLAVLLAVRLFVAVFVWAVLQP